MALSPNYNWSEPDNTSLVKDGAQAMRTLGDAIDTSVWNVGFGQAGKNKVINGGFDIWQRGTSFSIAASAGAAYYADRFMIATGASQAITLSRQATADTTNLPFIRYCTRIQRNSGQTGTALLNYATTLETANSIPLAGKTITISFYARAGANFSAASSQIGITVQTGTGTDQNVYTGLTGAAFPISSSATLTTTWQRFQYTATLAATATQIAFYTGFTPVGTAGANDYYEITGFQLEAGSKATPFQTASGGSIQGELAMCQRYYFRFTGPDVYSTYGIGYYTSTTLGVIDMPHPVPLRTKAASVDFGNVAIQNASAAISGVTGLTISQGSLKETCLDFTVGSGGTLGQTCRFLNNANAAGFIGLSAEL